MKFTEQEGSKRLLKNLKNFLLLLRRQPLTLLARPRRSLDNGVEMKFAFRQIVTILFGTSDRVVVLHQGLEIVRFFDSVARSQVLTNRQVNYACHAKF